MSKRHAALAILFTLILVIAATGTVRADERDAVERAVLDYVEAVYEGQPELIDRGVHTDLTKIGFYRREPGSEYQIAPMTFAELRDLAANFKDQGYVPDGAEYEIEILDLLDSSAAVKLSAFWGVDYMHLGKFDGEWKIIHVLWQSHPE